MSDKCYNHTEYTEIIQYNVCDAVTFLGWKKFVPVFHWIQKRLGDDNPIEYHEGRVEIGWPTDTPKDIEMYDDEILASNWKERPIHPDAISISPTSGTVKLATPLVELQLTASVTPAEYEFPISRRSSDTSKATVSSAWKVTPVAPGENITITATTWAVSATSTITVVKIDATWLTLEEDEMTLWLTEVKWIVPHIAPADAYNQEVTYESDDTDVATVETNGKVTWISAGVAHITVKSVDNPSLTATCTVTVEAESAPEE